MMLSMSREPMAGLSPNDLYKLATCKGLQSS